MDSPLSVSDISLRDLRWPPQSAVDEDRWLRAQKALHHFVAKWRRLDSESGHGRERAHDDITSAQRFLDFWIAHDLPMQGDRDLSSAQRCLEGSATRLGGFNRYIEDEASESELRAIIAGDAPLATIYPDVLASSLPVGIPSIAPTLVEILIEELGSDSTSTPHSAFHRELLAELQLPPSDPSTWNDWRPLSGLNLLPALSLSRFTYLELLGAIYAGEYLDVARCEAISNGLERLRMTCTKDHFYQHHRVHDAHHARDLFDRVILPASVLAPEASSRIWVGASMWSQCLVRYTEWQASTLLEPGGLPKLRTQL